MDGGPEALAEMSFTTIVQFACHLASKAVAFGSMLKKERGDNGWWAGSAG